MKFKAFMASIFLSAFILITQYAQAHEVYVLNADEIKFGISAPQPDFLLTIKEHLGQFLGAGVIVGSLVFLIFFVSISRKLERVLDPSLSRIKKIAPFVAQVTLGGSLVASGYYHAIFGIELPLPKAFAGHANTMSISLIILGSMLLIGILPRLVGIMTLSIFIALCIHYGFYMTNYATYAGEALTITIFGGAYAIHKSDFLGHLSKIIDESWHEYKFLLIRILFGISLIYASLYAKFFHGVLALETVSKYHLTNYFHFDPVFLVLGAMTLEILLGLFFLLGFEIRFASIFFLVFLTMSLLFFGESVWPHLMLIGTAIAMFLHGYDRYSLSTFLRRNKGEAEPVL